MVSNKDRSKIELKAFFGISNAQRELLRPFSVLCTVLCQFLVLAAVPGCGSGSESGGNLQAVDTAMSALAASPDLPTALSGKVVSPANNNIAVATTGSAEVSDAGTMSYSVPIWTPAGVNGMSPSLSIEYDSHSGWGLLGPKWNLGGLSVITRCGKTIAHDGVKGPVDFRGDTFCLDGKRLVRTSGSPGAVGEFRTEANPFEKIVVTAANASGVLTFQIFKTDGRVLFYGRTAASRLFGTPSTFPVNANSQLHEAYYAYYCDKITDRFGNSILIQYKNQVTGINKPEVKELVPTLIRWGATGDETTGQRSVQFNYLPTPDPNIHGVDRSNERFVSGLGILPNELLSSIVISGPNGSSGTMTLKKYGFSYNMDSFQVRPTSLSGITECDGSDICKRATTIQWEQGATTFTKIDLGITDVAMPNPPRRTCGAMDPRDQPGCTGGWINLDSNWYRRILTADVNHDGRDDIVYRQPTTFGSNSCIGWQYRLSQGTAFGLPGAINLGGDPDSNCVPPQTSTSGTMPYPGDLVFADLNRDSRPDILSFAGSASFLTVVTPQFNAYFANGGTGGGFGGKVAYEAPHLFAPAATIGTPGIAWNPQVSVADVSGDGIPDVVRPRHRTEGTVPVPDGNGGTIHVPVPPGDVMNSGIWWGSVGADGAYNVNVPPMTNGYSNGFSVVDVDGDGTAEILRDDTTSSVTNVVSPTMNGIINAPPNGNPLQDGQPGVARWFLDWNGDGLTDSVHINRSDMTKLIASVNTGRGFFQAGITTASQPKYGVGWGWRDLFDSGVRISDYNLDGRDDLVLVDNGATSAGPSRTKVVVLLSTGNGTFTAQETAIPLGDHADGFRRLPDLYTPVATGDHGYRTSVVMDINGDDLPDFVQLEWQRLIAYVRDGKKPDVVTKITEGTRRTIDVSYAPLSDSTAYVTDSGCPNNPQYYSCLVRGHDVVKSFTVSGGMISNTQSFKYTNGVVDKGGRGLLGFKRIDVYGAGSHHVIKTFDPTTFLRLDNGAPPVGPYMYPYVFQPKSVETHVDTEQGPKSHHYSNEVRTFTVKTFLSSGLPGFSVMPSTVTTEYSDCAPLLASGGPNNACLSSTQRMLGRQKRTTVFDDFGNLTSEVTEHYSSPTQKIQTDDVGIVYAFKDVPHWLVGLPELRTTTSTKHSGTSSESVTRKVKYAFDRTVNSVTSLSVGALRSEEFEPTGDNSTRQLRTIGRDTRGRVTSVATGTIFPSSTSCSTSCSPNCNSSCQTSCGATSGSCFTACTSSCMNACTSACTALPSDVRNTQFAYGDADGVYVSSTTDPVGNLRRVFRHPGYGFVVESVDPNGAASASTYDTFGRLLSMTAQEGASVAMDYSIGDTQPLWMSGSDIKISPEGKATRAITVHLDPFGNETDRSVPIDANRKLLTSRVLDPRGRIKGRSLRSLSGGVQTDITGEGLVYDDLDRATSICRSMSDGLDHCEGHTYDGLSDLHVTENGGSTTTISDAMGRVSIQRAVLTNSAGQSFTSDAAFTYGPFGVLQKENSGDGSGSTTITYDVLGRPTSLERTGVSLLLGQAYNAFGEVTGRYKVNKSTNARSEEVTMGYDKAGRLISQTSSGAAPGPGVPPGLNRRFHYDKNADGSLAPNGKGRLNDVVDSNFRVSLHFNYDSSGRTTEKKWTIFNPAVNQNETWSVLNAYDSQGRVDTMTYPRVPGETTPLAIRYAYDPYVGDPSSIHTATGGSPLWSANARNERGEVTSESMQLGAIGISRVTNYYLQEGLVKDSTLSSNAFGNPQTKLAYEYHFDGLPKTVSKSGIGGSWSSSFNYDNLSRLTSWSPAAGVDLTYRYDADGNMTSRGWSSGSGSANVTYGKTTPDANGAYNRTISGSGTGVTTFTHTYKADSFGRIFDTPVISIKNTQDDKIGSITEKSNGRLNTFIYDGQSRRVLTLFGTNGSAGTLLTLDDLFEVKRDSSGTEGRCRISAGGILVGDVVRRGTAARTATFYLTDNVGSVIAEASQSGTVTARSRRDPFGNLLTSATQPNLPSDPTGTNPDGSSRLGFATHNRDPNWGLVDMVNRGYSPRLGRFIYPDFILPNPLDRRDHNPFAYVRNAPTAAVDPLGLEIVPWDPAFGHSFGPSGYTTGKETSGISSMTYTDDGFEITQVGGAKRRGGSVFGAEQQGRANLQGAQGAQGRAAAEARGEGAAMAKAAEVTNTSLGAGGVGASLGGGADGAGGRRGGGNDGWNGSDYGPGPGLSGSPPGGYDWTNATRTLGRVFDKPGAAIESFGLYMRWSGYRFMDNVYKIGQGIGPGFRRVTNSVPFRRFGGRAGKFGDVTNIITHLGDMSRARDANDTEKTEDAISDLAGDAVELVIKHPVIGEAAGAVTNEVVKTFLQAPREAAKHGRTDQMNWTLEGM
jgi:RHS repeat-associated protein